MIKSRECSLPQFCDDQSYATFTLHYTESALHLYPFAFIPGSTEYFGLSLFGAFQRQIRNPGFVLLAIVEILMVSVSLGRLSFRLELLLAYADTTFVHSPRSTDPDRFSPTSRFRLVLVTYDLEDGIDFRSLYLTGLNRFMVSPLRLSHSSAYA